MNILVSACLLGVSCRYDGQSVPCPALLKALGGPHTLIPLCPEVFGGLATPRCPAERRACGVRTRDGHDVTPQYQQGAAEALRLAKLYDCRFAVLKERSPSCGSAWIYDGSFEGRVVPGEGVTAQLLRQNGIEVASEQRLPEWLFSP